MSTTAAATPPGGLRAPDLVVDSATGVEVAYEVVAPGGRMLAFLVDWLIRLALALAWYTLAAMLYNRSLSVAAPLDADVLWFGAVLLPAVSLYLLYHPALEIAMQGRTPGKRLTGIRIITTGGEAPGAGVLLLRNVFRLVDSFPGVYAVGFVATLATRNHVRLGDLAAGTLLVYEHADLWHGAPAVPTTDAAHAPDPESVEVITELEARWADLTPEARLRLGRRLATRLDPGGAWATADETRLRAALPALRAIAITDTAAPAREQALRTALLARADLWQAARRRVTQPGRAHDVRDALRLIEDYRLLARDLATARRLMPLSRARDFLESTYAQVHQAVHRHATHPGYAARDLFCKEIPEVVAQLRAQILWTALLFLLSGFAGAWLVTAHPGLAALFASPEMIASVERGELWTVNLLNVVPSSVLSIQLLTNNIVVSLFAFCAGILFGLGTFYIVGLNGFMLGGVFAFTAQHGLASRLLEFIVAHGIVEVACMVLAGAAGVSLGEALVRPAGASRTAAFSRAARRAGKLLVPIGLLLAGCGFIEGFVSPDPDVPLWARLVIGVGYFGIMIALLRGGFPGRHRHHGLRPIRT